MYMEGNKCNYCYQYNLLIIKKSLSGLVACKKIFQQSAGVPFSDLINSISRLLFDAYNICFIC